MPIEIVGQQLRIRVRSPRGARAYGTQALSPRLHRVAARYDGWATQSWRVNLSQFRTLRQALAYIDSRLAWLTPAQRRRAKNLVAKWWRRNKGVGYA